MKEIWKHTRAQLDQMPNAELNVVVAVEVMGWSSVRHTWPIPCFSPTTSWDAMGQVADKINEIDGAWLRIYTSPLDRRHLWRWGVEIYWFGCGPSKNLPFPILGNDLPRTVAIAAVLAKQEMKDGDIRPPV